MNKPRLIDQYFRVEFESTIERWMIVVDALRCAAACYSPPLPEQVCTALEIADNIETGLEQAKKLYLEFGNDF